jgi:hypothetical protein
VRNLLDRARPWLAVAGAALILAALLPSAGGYARRYAFVQAAQFVGFAAAGPALLVLGRRKGDPVIHVVTGRTGRHADIAQDPRAGAEPPVEEVSLKIH